MAKQNFSDVSGTCETRVRGFGAEAFKVMLARQKKSIELAKKLQGNPDAGDEDVGILKKGAANAILIPLRPLELSLDNGTTQVPEGKFLSLRATNTNATHDFTAGQVQAWLTIGKDTGVQGLKYFHRSGFTFPS